ncbi:hypothetical protein H5410_013155 [Solanum commersonii]|uniref:Uncharacterized protein n=1 Tax=Solanum commersonii TaxID=4109 RepID=A0A9J6AUB7_SOLCO|nr:hypothetical protein H5410_013155 [Solanum commersonii]
MERFEAVAVVLLKAMAALEPEGRPKCLQMKSPANRSFLRSTFVFTPSPLSMKSCAPSAFLHTTTEGLFLHAGNLLAHHSNKGFQPRSSTTLRYHEEEEEEGCIIAYDQPMIRWRGLTKTKSQKKRRWTADCIREVTREVLGVSRSNPGGNKEDWWWNGEVQGKVEAKKTAYTALVESLDEEDKRNRKRYKTMKERTSGRNG